MSDSGISVGGLDQLAAAFAAGLSDRDLAGTTKRLARLVQRLNGQRIKRQTGPDGARWSPRKPQPGHVKERAKMLQGFARPDIMLAKSSAEGLSVGYRGRIARFAEIHHYGKVDTVSAKGTRVKYAARQLLGLPESDQRQVLDLLEREVARLAGLS